MLVRTFSWISPRLLQLMWCWQLKVETYHPVFMHKNNRKTHFEIWSSLVVLHMLSEMFRVSFQNLIFLVFYSTIGFARFGCLVHLFQGGNYKIDLLAQRSYIALNLRFYKSCSLTTCIVWSVTCHTVVLPFFVKSFMRPDHTYHVSFLSSLSWLYVVLTAGHDCGSYILFPRGCLSSNDRTQTAEDPLVY